METVLVTALQVLLGIAPLVAICWLIGRRQAFYDEFESRRQPRIQSNDSPIWVHWSIETRESRDEHEGSERHGYG
jgi:hypothetical protein